MRALVIVLPDESGEEKDSTDATLMDGGGSVSAMMDGGDGIIGMRSTMLTILAGSGGGVGGCETLAWKDGATVWNEGGGEAEAMVWNEGGGEAEATV